jgi:NAD(P)-dependent dehydrogenase (short-subunit alcohol dehydrogenase family)
MISALAEIKEKLDGRLNALINNAGISIKCDQGKRLNSFETEMSAWRQVFDINFFASVFLSRELKQELASASGAIVNVTSIAGSRVHPFAGSGICDFKSCTCRVD